MMKLYEMADQYTQALEHMQDADSYEKFKDTLDSLDEPMQDKLDNIGLLRQNKLAEAEALKAEAKRLTDRAKAAEREADALATYVEFTMRRNNFKKLETPHFKFSFRKSTALIVSDIENVPEHFLKPQPPKPDVAGMKKYIKQIFDEKGLAVPEDLTETLGVKYENRESLQIK
jgi:isopentenyl diphosphate isomerase/L-lactate dehydrogenase-like FMN-dependent dehydrogenase